MSGAPAAPSWTEATARRARDSRRAMTLSLSVGLAMLAAKTAAYVITGSPAIFSDAAESVVHVVAVGFATFSLALSLRPPDPRFPYGYERIAFFSAGIEGGLIVVAAVAIIVTAIQKWIGGLEIERLGTGTLIVAVAGAVNAALGWYLVRTGRRHRSLILEANGRHVLTDSWTSAGVVGGLALVLLTGWLPFDPILALAVAANIMWSGGRLMMRSVAGLMDYSHPALEARLREQVDTVCGELGVRYHALRFRHTGHRLLVELHLLFPAETPLGSAHRLATRLERELPDRLGEDAEVVTHLEAIEDHGSVHPDGHHSSEQLMSGPPTR